MADNYRSLFEWTTTPDILMSVSEVYEAASERLLKRLEEDRRIERKPAGMHCESLGEYFSMWANTAPDGGLLIIGQTDDGEMQGCSSLAQKRINDLEKTGYVFCSDAVYDCKRVEVENPKGERDFILLFRVHYHETKVVETNRQKAFFRRGDSKIELKGESKRQLQLDKGQVSIEREPCGLVFPDDFDAAAMTDFASAVKKRTGLSDQHTLRDILERHRLGKKHDNNSFVPNIACALLFAKDIRDKIPGVMIKVQRYAGTTRETGLKRNVEWQKEITGRLPEMIEGAAEAIRSQVREFSRLTTDNKFLTISEYPEEAWYEAIVNACVHRSYDLKNMNIFVRIFDDRMVIDSPGPFLPFVTPENIYESHHRRNWWTMDALQYLDFVKCENEGVLRMRDSMRELGLPDPEFDQKEVGGAVVRVTLWNRLEERGIGGRKSVKGGRKSAESGESSVYYADHSPLPDAVSEQIPNLRKRASKAKVVRAILVLCEWRPLRAEEIADYTHRTSAKKLVESYLSPMVAKGFLQYTIPDNPSHKGQRYRTTETGSGALLEGDVEL